MAYNVVFHAAPFRSEGEFHWHVHLLPKVTTQAGFELGTGVPINICPPETAGQAYRVGARRLSPVAVDLHGLPPADGGLGLLQDIASHVTWMDDAVSITFTSRPSAPASEHRFVCVTRVGPIRLRDHMRVVEWVEGRRIGIAHGGRLLGGEGTFILRRRGSDRTRLVWRERIRPPWWLGGALSGFIAGQVFRPIAAKDLRNLRALFG